MSEGLPLIGRERGLFDELTDDLSRLVGGPPPSRAALGRLRRHDSTLPTETRRGSYFDVRITGPDGKPTAFIARVTVELERFEEPT